MLLREIRDYIAALGLTDDEKCYCAKMPDKQLKSIGIYNLKKTRLPIKPQGGLQNGSYGVKSVSLLIHWNKNQTETEQAALKLQEALIHCRNTAAGESEIAFIQVYYDEPVPVDTDEKGIYEYVIECDIYYKKG